MTASTDLPCSTATERACTEPASLQSLEPASLPSLELASPQPLEQASLQSLEAANLQPLEPVLHRASRVDAWLSDSCFPGEADAVVGSSSSSTSISAATPGLGIYHPVYGHLPRWPAATTVVRRPRSRPPAALPPCPGPPPDRPLPRLPKKAFRPVSKI